MFGKQLTGPALPAANDRLDAELHRMLAEWRTHATHGRELVDSVNPADDHLRGDPAAPVTVVEYGCLTSRGESEDDANLRVRLRDWIEAGRICVAFRHFPLIDTHPGALFAARAVEAAEHQIGFWQLRDALADTLAPMGVHPSHSATRVVRGVVSAVRWMVQPEKAAAAPPDIRLELQPASVLEIARRAGFDSARLVSDMKRPDVAAKILRDVDGGIRSGVNGAPTFYVQGVRQDVEGAGELAERIEHALIGDRAALWPPSHEPALAQAEIAKRWTDAVNGGSLSSAGWDENIVWHGWNEELPGGGSAVGRQAVEALHQRPRSGLQRFRVGGRHYIEHGERLVVLGQIHGEVADRELHIPYAQVWEFRAGKARRVEALTDTLAIASALSGTPGHGDGWSGGASPAQGRAAAAQ